MDQPGSSGLRASRKSANPKEQAKGKKETMKKLMIVATLAAMTGVALADAQVYDVKLKVKTTQCKSAKLSKAIADLGWFGGLQKGDAVAFRGSATRKVAGVIWGCDCDTISRPGWRVQGVGSNAKGVGGYAFWDQTTSPYRVFQIPYTTFNWAVLNRVGKMKNVEGTWIVGDTAENEAFYVVGAGFGSCTLVSDNDCASVVKSMSGNFAGLMEYSYVDSDGCIFCGESYSYCLVAPFCVCWGGAARNTVDFTAAYGTWQIKYNSSESKKLRTKAFITAVRNFTGSKAANIGVALDAAYDATLEATAAKKLTPATSDFNTSKVKSTPTNKATVDTIIKSSELATLGKYYTTYLPAKWASYKNADKSKAVAADPGSISETKVAKLPSVAGALFKSLDHVESAAAQGDADDWGDDDWGDDDDDDDWDF
jgi:hypothetical protein